MHDTALTLSPTTPFAPIAAAPTRRVLIVGRSECAAVNRSLRLASRWTIVDRAPTLAAVWQVLNRNPTLYDATLLASDRPGCLPADAKDELAGHTAAGEVIEVRGPWCEGMLRVQGAAGDSSIVYWHALPSWLEERFRPDEPAATTGLLLVASRDFDAAESVADALKPNNTSVLWWPRGGRRPQASRVDAGLWIGGQLDGRAADELADFCRVTRQLGGGRTVTLLDFPRQDEIALAEHVGVSAVLAKPWSSGDLAEAVSLPGFTNRSQPRISLGVTSHAAGGVSASGHAQHRAA